VTEQDKEYQKELNALHELEGSYFRGYLDKLLAETDKSLRMCRNDADMHRLQGTSQFIYELCGKIDGAFEEMTRLRLKTTKPDMSKAF
jgi:hypothetical protein